MNKRLSSISSNEQVFNLARPPYQDALNKSGYNFTLKFDPPIANQNKKPQRQRKITWFNPPFSRNVRTNIGEQFLKLIDKNFPQNHPLRKVISRNTVKILYRCPLEGNCLVNSLVYRAEVTHDDSTSTTYTGLTCNTFKKRYYGHRHSFNNRNSEHSSNPIIRIQKGLMAKSATKH